MSLKTLFFALLFVITVNFSATSVTSVFTPATATAQSIEFRQEWSNTLNKWVIGIYIDGLKVDEIANEL